MLGTSISTTSSTRAEGSAVMGRSSRQQVQRGPQLRQLRSGAAAAAGAAPFAARGRRQRYSSQHPQLLRCAALPGSDDAEDLLLGGESVCPVPMEQQPMNELKQLQEMFLFDWATIPPGDFGRKLAGVWAGFYLALGLPVSAFTFDVHSELPQCLAAASAGSCFIVTVLVWRLYLGWQHVGDRLISATVEYEETGWYDGQTWVKTPQVLLRDRLLSNYTVKPALARLKRALLGLGGALMASMLLLAALGPPPSANASFYDSSYYDGSGSRGAYEEEAVATYEPWAAAGEEGDDDAPAAFDMRSHMQQVLQE